MTKFRIIKRKADCVLLMQCQQSNRVKYMVKDIEGEIIYMNFDNLKGAEKAFEEYDLEKVRAEKKRIFGEWLRDFAEA